MELASASVPLRAPGKKSSRNEADFYDPLLRWRESGLLRFIPCVMGLMMYDTYVRGMFFYVFSALKIVDCDFGGF